jgi:hypothetical protein
MEDNFKKTKKNGEDLKKMEDDCLNCVNQHFNQIYIYILSSKIIYIATTVVIIRGTSIHSLSSTSKCEFKYKDEIIMLEKEFKLISLILDNR